MEHYDVLIAGNDVGSLAIALYLARKMRKIVVFAEPLSKPTRGDRDELVAESGEKFVFRTPLTPPAAALSGDGLLAQYLGAFGLGGEVASIPAVSDAIVGADGTIRRRVKRIEQFAIYLVRHYPKQRDRIHRFLADMDRLRRNYQEQQRGLLANTDYTITSLMIEWGDRTLAELLGKYFTDADLIAEFTLFADVNGLAAERISCYNFFISFMNGMTDGWHHVLTTEEDLSRNLLSKLALVNPKIVQNRKIKAVAVENGKILKVIDEAGKEIAARYFVIGSDPLRFYADFFPELTAEREAVARFFPDLGTKRRFGTLQIGIATKPIVAGIEDEDYQFHADPAEPLSIVRLFNQKVVDPDAATAKNGALVCGFAYEEDTPVEPERILETLYGIFPKLKKYVVASRLGPSRPLYAMLPDESVRKGLSIDHQIEVESGDACRMQENLFLVGRWFRPEAGLFGVFQHALNYADQIEERMYHGDDEELRTLSNDEIMMIIRQNFGKKTLGAKEKHVNFHIGKSDYFIRTKAKNITLHRGSYSQPDVTIYSTNDKLTDLLLRKIGLQEVMESGGFKYQGTENDLYDVVEAFRLDEFQNDDEPTYQPKTKIYFAGVKILFGHLLAWSIAALLSNFVPMIWIAPFALAFSLALIYLKYVLYRRVSWFEFLLVAVGIGFTVAAILSPAFNHLLRDDPLLGILGLAFFVSWLANRPIVYDFHRFDFRGDYADTALFKVVNNGLNLVWALIFFIILGFVYISGERYVTVLYDFVFLGIFLTYYYPWLYVKTNIKK